MKTRIMILACLLAVPGAYGHNNRLTLNRKLQYRHKATPSSSGKEKETCASRCTKSSWKTEKRKKYKFMKGVYLEKVDADKRTFLDALPFIPKREDTMLTNRTVRSVYLATAGWLTTSFPSELKQATRWDSTYPSHGNSANILSVYHNSRRARIGNQPGSQLGIPFFQYRR